jgi:hypothetical protein
MASGSRNRTSADGAEVGEMIPLNDPPSRHGSARDDNDDDDDDDFGYGAQEYFASLKGESIRRESMMADRLSMRLLAIPDDDSEAEDAILHETLDISVNDNKSARSLGSSSYRSDARSVSTKQAAQKRLLGMVGLAILAFVILVIILVVGVQFIGPPSQPVGDYKLVERQVGQVLFAVAIHRVQRE